MLDAINVEYLDCEEIEIRSLPHNLSSFSHCGDSHDLTVDVLRDRQPGKPIAYRYRLRVTTSDGERVRYIPRACAVKLANRLGFAGDCLIGS